MNELIGLTVKTHDNQIVGKVVEVEPRQVGVKARAQFGIAPSEPYIALSVLMSEGNWTTFIARDGFEIHKRYVL